MKREAYFDGWQCVQCKHFIEDDEAGMPRCRAFPQGIPQIMLFGQWDHRKPLKGDRGIRFEPLPKVTGANQ